MKAGFIVVLAVLLLTGCSREIAQFETPLIDQDPGRVHNINAQQRA